ncbi:hypothetical protein [Glycomyces albidus]|uniref:Uncharacterized protein n=1 Tax=Glycomyces albidus TaxID=2656774 RepID=A0A6L5GEC8_9ACTN|nr:hypothetical protein [Glycomyces albidus]MQM28062.1 hypothetical protein [Glycomyces albidus]
MPDSAAAAGPARPDRTPGVVIAAMALASGAGGLGAFVGLYAAITLWALRSGGGPDSAWHWVEVPPYTAAVTQVCLWFNLAWLLLRAVASFGFARGSATARVAAIAAEAAAAAVWIAMLFLHVEGRHKLGDDDPFTGVRIAAGACIVLSAVVILLLRTPSAKRWCDRR